MKMVWKNESLLLNVVCNVCLPLFSGLQVLWYKEVFCASEHGLIMKKKQKVLSNVYFVVFFMQRAGSQEKIDWRGRWKLPVQKEGSLRQSSAKLSHHLVMCSSRLGELFAQCYSHNVWPSFTRGQFNNSLLVYKLQYYSMYVKKISSPSHPQGLSKSFNCGMEVWGFNLLGKF